MKKYSLLFISLLLVLSSCSSSSEKSELQYFPFKESKGDNWGLIDASGKVLIADEFKGEPTAVINGMFFVKTDDAIELYKATDPTKPVGEKFKAITSFQGKYAPSVKKGEGIKYVDENGRIVSELPLDYNKATAFDKGYSLIRVC